MASGKGTSGHLSGRCTFTDLEEKGILVSTHHFEHVSLNQVHLVMRRYCALFVYVCCIGREGSRHSDDYVEFRVLALEVEFHSEEAKSKLQAQGWTWTQVHHSKILIKTSIYASEVEGSVQIQFHRSYNIPRGGC